MRDRSGFWVVREGASCGVLAPIRGRSPRWIPACVTAGVWEPAAGAEPAWFPTFEHARSEIDRLRLQWKYGRGLVVGVVDTVSRQVVAYVDPAEKPKVGA